MASKAKGKKRGTNAKKKPAPKQASSLLRYLRGLLGFATILAILAAAGSFYMRNRVVRLLKGQAISSSSVVMGRAYPITRGIELSKIRLSERTARLGYRRVKGVPERRGQYSVSATQAHVFLRGGKITPQLEQQDRLIRLDLDGQGIIRDIVDVKFDQPLKHVWLEPEILSLLGNSSTRAVVPKDLRDISPKLVDAVIAIEDERFYSHFGIDLWAVLRAAWVNLRAGRIVQGGSTITQQLAKNLFRDSERTIVRKIREAFSAILIETAFSKKQILEMYLNEVFLGQEGRVAIHGFGEAARSFFDKDVAELSLAEAATLAGIIKAPSKYSPRRYPERAKRRRGIVLNKMFSLEQISRKEQQSARKAQIVIRAAQRSKRTAPYFVDYVRRTLGELLEEKEIDSRTLQVYTGLDVLYQQCAEQAVESGLARLEKQHKRLAKAKPPLQAALIAANPAGGDILAWVGGRDYGSNQFDRISQASRQPGSAFKPFVYLTAVDRQLNTYRVARPTSVLIDEPLQIKVPGGTWEPKNYDKKFRGEVTIRQALAKSLNVPTVNLARKVGIANVARTAALFGFGDDLPRVPSLALGAGEVSPLEMAKAYAALANGGVLLELRPILSVGQNNRDTAVYQAALDEHRVASEPAVFVLTNMLQSVIEHGTGRVVRRMGFKHPAAGKTGTSNDTRDTWFAGFTPRLLAVVWVGFDNNRPVKLTGAGAAAPIWTEFVKCASRMEPTLDFLPPPGVLYKRVDLISGLLDVGHCPASNVVTEVFVEGTEPVSPCPIHTPRRRYGENEAYKQDRPDNRRRRPGRRKDSGQTFWERLFDW